MTRVEEFLGWLDRERGVRCASWRELWQWSVDDLDGFWSAIWDRFGVESDTGYEQVLGDDRMPGAQWFTGSRINYARHLLAQDRDAADVAVTAYSQTRDRIDLTFGELREQVGRARAALASLGVGRGDRVAAYLPNLPETVVAFLATASLGAIWSSCAPEFGARGVVDRFSQIDPEVLLVVGGYAFGAKPVDRRGEVAEIVQGLPTVQHVVEVRYGPDRIDGALDWAALLAAADAGEPQFEPVPFDHPLFVLFSSGTTGKPKAIVHGHGGILLEHLKNHALSWDLGPGDTMLWFSTTAWMMWNALVSGLLVGSRIVLVDGNPLYPSLDWQWRLAEETGTTVMGASPGFLMACRKEGLHPAKEHDLSRIKQIGAAGSPLPLEGYQWVAGEFGDAVVLNIGSGGTDVCSGIVQGNPLEQVTPGRISGACLGVAAAAFDPHGRPVIDELGELVITRPMPSMPVGLWGDDGTRYRDTYFDTWDGVWRHGDWVEFDAAGTCHVAGRSDATLNRGGVRLGTAEFYRVVEELPEVVDSLVVHLEDPAGGNGQLVLFVALVDGIDLDDTLRATIGRELRSALSPRHTPDEIVQVPVIPTNRTGKKLELPAKRLLQGRPLDEVVSRDALSRPDALDAIAEHARARGASS